MEIKAWLIIGSYAAVLMIGWHGHTWYDGYLKSKEQTEIIDSRIESEKLSNEAAAKAAAKESENENKARETDAEVEKHIAAERSAYSCVVPTSGVLDLQQAVAATSGSGKPN